MKSNRWMIPVVAALTLAGAACEESPAEVTEAADQVNALALQEAPGRFGPGSRGILEMAEALELSDAQVAEIQGVLTGLREQNAPLMERLRASGERPARPRRGEEPSAEVRQMRENSIAAMGEIQEVLTDEQQQRARELFQERREQAREMRDERGPRGPRGGPGADGAPLLRLTERLQLTDQQVAQIEAIQTALQEKNAPLVEQLRASGERPFRGRDGGEPGPLAQELRANMQAAREEMRAVLTAEQQAALEELREQRPRRGHRGPGGGEQG